MFSGFKTAVVTLLAVIAGGAALDYHMWTRPVLIRGASGSGGAALAQKVLRVCADPNNLPFSNRRGEGFENALARLVAHDLDRQVEYTWWPQRRGFVRTTLKAGRCDVIMGVPAGFDLARATTPYYRSSYVFVTRADQHLDLRSFDDPRLRTLRIGVHIIGDDYANIPPAQALASRGIVNNVRGYSIYGDYSKPDPPRELLDALARGDIDVAIVWGPIGGYFAAKEPVPLEVTPVNADARRDPGMQFAIAAGVRRDDDALAQAVEHVFTSRRADIVKLLRSYHVPLTEATS